MRCCDAAVQVLKETENEAVMWGDGHLLHQIAARMGWNADSWATEKRVLDALTRCPGMLIAKKTLAGNGRTVRIFRLPESEETHE